MGHKMFKFTIPHLPLLTFSSSVFTLSLFAHSLCYLVPLLFPLFLPPLLLHFPLLSICDFKQDQTASTTTASTFFTIIIIIIIKNRDGILDSSHKQHSISHLFR